MLEKGALVLILEMSEEPVGAGEGCGEAGMLKQGLGKCETVQLLWKTVQQLLKN